MDQDKIGNLIKKLRKDSNLTQAQFAEKYGVSFQAVSKWENGKNIPDITLLKQICSDYNISIDNILNGNEKKKNKKKFIIIMIVIFIILLFIILGFATNIFNKDDFQFRTISSSCSKFDIHGSLAYGKNNSYLHLSNINYCDDTDTTIYDNIECSLYEQNGNIKKELGKCNYLNNKNVKLGEFLENVEFYLGNFSKDCKYYNDNSLYLEINATDKSGKITNYKVQLALSNSCKNNSTQS